VLFIFFFLDFARSRCLFEFSHPCLLFVLISWFGSLEAVSFSGWSERRARKSLMQAMRAGQIWSFFLLVNAVPGFLFSHELFFFATERFLFPSRLRS
jgi:hypothetical protein